MAIVLKQMMRKLDFFKMFKRLKLETILFMVAILLIISSIIIYFIFKPQNVINFASYLAGISTLGLFFLTIFYVIYINRQIIELQKQRQLQIQPLPNLEIIDSAIMSPRIVMFPEDGKVSLVVDFYSEIKMKNIGNGAAVLVDSFMYFKGKDIKFEPDKFYSTRHFVVEQNEETSFTHSIRDEYFEALKALNKSVEKGCAIYQAFDVLISLNILYRNILGTAFLSSLDHVIVVDDTTQEKISDWLGSIDSFNNEYSGKLAKFTATYPRSREDAYKILSEIKNDYYSKCTPQMLNISVLPLSQSFQIRPLEIHEVTKISKKIYHGIPLRERIIDEKIKESQDWKSKLLELYFESQQIKAS